MTSSSGPVDREALRTLGREVLSFLPDVVVLLRGVSQDPRVPRRVKVEVGAAAAYLVLPIDLIPDFIPGLGQLDDLAVLAWAVRRMMLGAGEPVMREHWRGSDRGLEVLLQLVSSGLRPKRVLAGLLAGWGAAGAARRSHDERVVDSELG